ncbi:MAG TPA: competence/damage-inducible protein A [Solirubrobacteraceae bacterium]|jgi:nicotinamide-nucleotide amidase|nr:competence/damage-inducible protein A [Solirubrobacteraceae bacterium]
MSARAGIVVTGTEVLTGRVVDRNGPFLSDRLRELGVDLAHIAIVGDRPEDMEAALGFMAAQGMDLVITSGGLGPTADDLTAEVVGRFHGRETALDEALESRIAEIVAPLVKRWPNLDLAAIEVGTRKQAMVPLGATVLEPVGTAPGLVVPPPEGAQGPTIVVLPGPPRELQPMWGQAVQAEALKAALSGATTYEQRTLRLFGMPESEIAETLRVAEREGVQLDRLEVTTCLKRGEIEVVTRYEPDARAVYEAFARIVSERHADTLFSSDGSTIDDLIAVALAQGHTIATAESCTGGLLVARLTDRPGSSDYVKGGVVVYGNEAKVSQAGVPAELIERHGAVSPEVAEALARGAQERLRAEIGVGITGIAGPGGGSAEKPVGLVCFSIAGPGGELVTRSVNLPGGRSDVRERSTTVAMHLLLRALSP